MSSRNSIYSHHACRTSTCKGKIPKDAGAKIYWCPNVMKWLSTKCSCYDEPETAVQERIQANKEYLKAHMKELKLWNVEFESMWPVGGCLILLAYDEDEAKRIASMTISHTSVFSVTEILMDGPKVVVYNSGEY